MPLAVLAMVAESNDDLITAEDYYREAIHKDTKNTTAWLWQGISQHTLGLLPEAVKSLEQCLKVDPAYLNCRQHLASVLLDMGQTQRAMQLSDETLEHVFHSVSGAFASTYVRTGHRLLAVHIADGKLGWHGAPVIEWIRAIENPDADNSAGLARMLDWFRRTHSAADPTEMGYIYLSFKAYDKFASDPFSASFVLWHPDAEEFRRSPQFKQVIRQLGVLHYWRERGFPPQCRPVGEDDFECGSPAASGKT